MILVLVKHPVLNFTFLIRKEAVARKRHLWMTSWLLSVTSLYVFCDSFVFHYILTLPVDFGFIFPLPSSIHKWYMTFGERRMAQSHFDKVVKWCSVSFKYLLQWDCFLILIIYLSVLSPRKGIPGIVSHLIPFFTLGKLSKILGPRVGTFNFVCKEESHHDSVAILK